MEAFCGWSRIGQSGSDTHTHAQDADAHRPADATSGRYGAQFALAKYPWGTSMTLAAKRHPTTP